MRKQLLAVLLPLVILALIAGAETQSTSANVDRATVQKVDVMHADDGIRVEITAHGAVTPKLSALGSPARILVSLPNTSAATAQNHIDVGSDGVKGVRIGTDGHTPPTTSVVIDLVQACGYELVAGGENKIVVKLHPVASPAKTSAKAVAPAKLQTVAAVVAPKVVSPKNDAGAVQKAAPVAAPASTKSASANDLVFVEPTYQPKSAAEQTATPAVPVPDAAKLAAAKFVDKPEGNLLPAPSAALQQDAQAPATTAIQPAVNLAAEQKGQSHMVTPITTPKYTGEPISVNLKDVDLKDFFRLIHEISGLKKVVASQVATMLSLGAY